MSFYFYTCIQDSFFEAREDPNLAYKYRRLPITLRTWEKGKWRWDELPHVQ